MAFRDARQAKEAEELAAVQMAQVDAVTAAGENATPTPLGGRLSAVSGTGASHRSYLHGT